METTGKVLLCIMMTIWVLVFVFGIFQTVQYIKYAHQIDKEYSWYCSEIICGHTRFVKAEMTCGNYYVFEKRCTMINCTEPVECEEE